MESNTSAEIQSKVLLNVSQRYQEFTESIDSTFLSELSSLAEQFKKDAQFSKEENRLLRIGIIGQIKRGKSSFLNSLLFNGQDILPKAATPMTAALTKIRYAAQPVASIEFYNENEWLQIEKRANLIKQQEQEYLQALERFKLNREKGKRPPTKQQISDEEKACVELLNMVVNNGVNVGELLGKTKVLEGITKNEHLIDELKAYVGADGQFTPLVKSTDLALNIEALKDIEVVDTPGMNDPIVSRGRRTQEFIGQCDVIFFLSYCGQFLDMHDMGLLAQNIPAKGIKDIVLIGSIFDGALLDEYHKYSSIQEAFPALTNKLNEQAQRNVNHVCEKDEKYNNGQSTLMSTFKDALPPVFISSRFYDLGNKDYSQLNEEELHSLQQLNGMFDGFTFTHEQFKTLANFSKVDEKLQIVRGKKESIMRERFDNLLTGSKQCINVKLNQIKESVTQKRTNLLEGDLEEITKNQERLAQKIEAGKTKVNNVFEKYSIEAEKKLIKLQYEIQQESLVAKQVDSTSGTRTVTKSVYAGTERCGFLWLSTRDVYRPEARTVTYTYANVHNAITKLEEFVLKASKELFEASQDAIDINLFRNEIKDSVKGMFDFNDDNFDPQLVLTPLNNAVLRITIPSINLDFDKHINTIREQFSSAEVEGDEIAELRKEQNRVVVLLLAEIGKELKNSIATILEKLVIEREKFVPSLTKDLAKNVQQLKEDLVNKEKSLASYDEVLVLLNEDIIN